MANKSAFSAEEWDLLRQAPFMTGMVVVAADPSGPIGLMQESAAASGMVLDVIKGAETELMKSIGEDLKASLQIPKLASHSQEAVRAAGLDIIRRASNAVRAKGSLEEGKEFRAWLNSLAQKVAEASKEGGFLGFGGTLVSDAEKQSLNDIAAALSDASLSAGA